MKRLKQALLLTASLLFLAATVVLPVYPAGPAGTPATRPDRTVAVSEVEARAYWERLLSDSQKAVRGDPSQDDDPQDLFWLAVAAANLGRLDESTDSFRELQKADPERKVVHKLVADCRAVLSQDPDNLQALNGLAFVAYANEDFAQAASYFQQLVRIEPSNPWTRNYLGFSLGKSGRLDEAISVLEEGRRRFPDNEFTHFLLGLAYYQKGWVVRALGELAKAPRAIRYFR